MLKKTVIIHKASAASGFTIGRRAVIF